MQNLTKKKKQMQGKLKKDAELKKCRKMQERFKKRCRKDAGKDEKNAERCRI